jgi:excisionase family DNA binding protein
MKPSQKKNESARQREPWVSLADACQYLGISKVTMRRWIKEGHMIEPKRTPGGEFRFRISELDDLLE